MCSGQPGRKQTIHAMNLWRPRGKKCRWPLGAESQKENGGLNPEIFWSNFAYYLLQFSNAIMSSYHRQWLHYRTVLILQFCRSLTWVQTRLKSRCWQGGLCSFFREAPGKDLFPYSYRLLAEFSCLQLQDRAPCFLAGCQLRVIPSFYKPHTFLGLWPLSSIFRASNGGRILLMLQISPLLISLTQLGKGFCFLKTHVITLGPLR